MRGEKIILTRKVFVIDTNVLLHDPFSIYKLGDNDIVVPAIVLEELDSKKRLPDGVGKNARVFARLIKELRREFPGQLSKGIHLSTGGTLRVELNHIKENKKIKDSLLAVTADNRILTITMNLKKEIEDQEVILITNDGLLGAKADAFGIRAEEYENDRLVSDAAVVHKGYHHIKIDEEIIDSFYTNKKLSFDKVKDACMEETFINDFFFLEADGYSKKTALAKLVHQNGGLFLIKLQQNDKIKVSHVSPKNAEQKMLIELLMDPQIEMVCVTGQAGTGKTLLSLAAALELIEEEVYEKVLVARPYIAFGKDIGALPGDKEEKVRPWMQPIYDNLEFIFHERDKEKEKKEKQKNMEEMIASMGNKIQIEVLTYIRGRSIPNQIMILDECQNLTPMEIKTIITRMGEHSKLILCGDPDQIDHPYLDSINNGLVYAIERMKQEPEVGVIHLRKTERSSLADKAARLL